MERLQVVCTRPVQALDDGYHVDIREASGANCLATHPSVAKSKLDCRYVLEGVGEYVVPGLSESVFESPVTPLFLPTGTKTRFNVVRLPGVHVLLNQAQKAIVNGAPYNWDMFAFDLQRELLSLLGQVVASRCLRTHEHDGFMALAQASPGQLETDLVIGVEMARAVLPMARRLNPAVKSIGDLNGRRVICAIRYPATHSSGVKLRMTLRVAGRGRCAYVHPAVLKGHFLGDVDGDILYVALDPYMRVLPYEHQVCVPTTVERQYFDGDVSLYDVCHRPYDKLDIYRGHTSKGMIGLITNAFYKSILVAHKEFQWTAESRLEFLMRCGRSDLLQAMKETPDEALNRSTFRWLSAVALMDAFSAWYESCFDARKDTGNLHHIEYFLGALRDPDNFPLDGETFRDFEWNGAPVDMRPILAVWEACGGRLGAYVDDLTIQALFFDGKGDTERRKDRLATILAWHGDAPASRIWKELNNEVMTFVDEEGE